MKLCIYIPFICLIKIVFMLLGLTQYLSAEVKNFPFSFACPTTKRHVVSRNARTRNPGVSVHTKNLQTLSPSNKSVSIVTG
jgi:hypothetical protein